MFLSVENIGKVSKAEIELNGITVIAGENDTGKSTIGKTLYVIFNSFYDIENQIFKMRIDNIEYLLGLIYRNTSRKRLLYTRADLNELAKIMVNDIEKEKNDFDDMKSEILEILNKNNILLETDNKASGIDEILERIIDNLKVSDDEIIKLLLERRFSEEFNGQITNLYNKKQGNANLIIKERKIEVGVIGGNVLNIIQELDVQTEAVYLDDPFVLDGKNYSMGSLAYSNHEANLFQKLDNKRRNPNLIDEIIVKNKFDNIYKKISLVCDGELRFSQPKVLGYQITGTEDFIDVRNLSAGLKTFIIIKMLMENGTIQENGTIILDEPEIHLHPEWQLLFAEIIVLLQKEFGMHILLTTHSPYFLRAIQVYSAAHGIADKCKYYLAENVEKQSKITDVTKDIEKVYAKLARPLETLEITRFEDNEQN